MVHLYEKTCKTNTNPYGIIEITNENPIEQGPCIITILAYPKLLKDINGSLRQVANIINPDIDYLYDNNRRLLGLGFGEYNKETTSFTRYSPTDEELEEFMQKYFYPLISQKGQSVNVLLAMKNIRNITFITYCNGAILFKRIEAKLSQKMLDIGYTNSEIGMILSQICHAAISGTVIKRNQTKTLTISFGDVLDIEFNKDKELIQRIDTNNGSFIQYDSSIGYGIIGNGEHSFKKHMTENKLLSSKIKIFLETSLENALYNHKNNMINPITYQKIDEGFAKHLIKIKK